MYIIIKGQVQPKNSPFQPNFIDNKYSITIAEQCKIVNDKDTIITIILSVLF